MEHVRDKNKVKAKAKERARTKLGRRFATALQTEQVLAGMSHPVQLVFKRQREPISVRYACHLLTGTLTAHKRPEDPREQSFPLRLRQVKGAAAWVLLFQELSVCLGVASCFK